MEAKKSWMSQTRGWRPIWVSYAAARKLQIVVCDLCGEDQKKECNNCFDILPLDLFNKAVGRSGEVYYGRNCRKCIYSLNPGKAKDSSKRWRMAKKELDPSHFRNTTQLYRDRNTRYIEEYLLNHPCARCGESDVEVLEFDHLDPTEKEYTIAQLVGGGMGLIKLQKEMAKCQVLCSNCHRKKTIQDRGGTTRSKLLNSLNN